MKRKYSLSPIKPTSPKDILAYVMKLTDQQREDLLALTIAVLLTYRTPDNVRAFLTKLKSVVDAKERVVNGKASNLDLSSGTSPDS